MKKLIFEAVVFFLFMSCTLVKSYDLIGDDKKVNIKGKKVIEIDLETYDVYKREVFFKNDEVNLYKGYGHPDSTFKRYEAQFFLVEKGDFEEKRMIYFSYIPPYKIGNNYYLNQKVFNENPNLVNLHLINYMYFGKVFQDKIVQINKGKSLSTWKIDFDRAKTQININSVTFIDRGRIKTKNTSNVLGNPPIYKKIDYPDIILHQDLDSCISVKNSDFVSNCILYYDLNEKCVYLRFNDYLEKEGEKKVNRWIKYDSDRIKSVYE